MKLLKTITLSLALSSVESDRYTIEQFHIVVRIIVIQCKMFFGCFLSKKVEIYSFHCSILTVSNRKKFVVIFSALGKNFHEIFIFRIILVVQNLKLVFFTVCVQFSFVYESTNIPLFHRHFNQISKYYNIVTWYRKTYSAMHRQQHSAEHLIISHPKWF